MENQKKTRNQEVLYCSLFIIIPLLLYGYETSGGLLAGSKVDWLSQHSVFPEYFRQRFYETGNCFPQFSSELGGGQNIYNFAYYGLFNPLYFFSWLLPFLPMTTYLQILSLLELMGDGILCYIWLGRHFSKSKSCFSSLILLLSMPLLYHSQNQLMFVQYMPFLLLAFLGVDRYREKKRWGFFVLGVTGMLLCSFYFAVGGMVALFLYQMAWMTGCELRKHPVKCFWQTVFPFLLSLLLTLFYLLPVFCAMRTGRVSHSSVELLRLLIPSLSATRFLYQPYGLGLTAMALFMFCVMLTGRQGYRKWKGKPFSPMLLVTEKIAWMLTMVFCIPLFEWVLNGGLYVRDKVLIPFLPLVVWIIAAFCQTFLPGDSSKEQDRNPVWENQSLLLGLILAAGVLLISWLQQGGSEERAVAGELKLPVHILVFGVGMLDLLVSFSALRAQRKSGKPWVYMVTFITMLLVAGVELQYYRGGQVSQKMQEQLEDCRVKKLMKRTQNIGDFQWRMEVRGGAEYQRANLNRILVPQQKLTTCYSSMFNFQYFQFRSRLGVNQANRNYLMQNSTSNPLFLRFMGVRYLVGRNVDDMQGWNRIGEEGDVGLYENSHVAPLFYLTDQTISRGHFDALSDWEQQLALLEGAVVEQGKGKPTKRQDRLRSISLRLSDTGIIHNRKAVKKTVKLPEKWKKGQILFLSFRVKNNNPSQDVVVTINGESNKLTSKTAIYYNGNTTFHYTLSIAEHEQQIYVQFGTGDYEISEVKAAIGQPDNSGSLYQIPLMAKMESSGDGWSMTCETEKERLLVSSVPYDSHFRVYVDGEESEVQKVNMAFLGVMIPSGTHHVRIVYEAPGSRAGLLFSGATLILLLGGGWYKSYFRKR